MRYLLFALCIGLPFSTLSQNPGKIIFTSQPGVNVAISATYLLTPKSDLFFTAHMDSPLVRYLQALSPAMDQETVLKQGNYQFSLYVDNRLCYQSNLHPGAPSAAAKIKDTVLSRPLINYKAASASWSEYYWMRFLRNGGDSALTEGPHLLRMEIRPYLNDPVKGIKTGALIASGELPLMVDRKPFIDTAKIVLNTPAPYNGLTASRGNFDRNTVKLLKGNIEAGVFPKITSIAVIRKGQLIIEEYFNGSGRDSTHDVRSVGKSFAGAITGLAIRDGYLRSTEQPLSDFYDLPAFANYSTEKAQTPLKALLTMSSPFDGDDNNDQSPGNEENMYPTDNWVKFALDLPVNTARPAGEWHYFTAGVVVLGDVLHQRVPGGLEKYADHQLFRPLGITRYQWQYTPQGVANTAGGIRMNTLDFAKFGWLYQQQGRWQGRQVLPAGWVQQTFTRHKNIPGRQEEYYGYLFWNKTFQVNGQTYEAYYCSGNGGNYILVFRNTPLVIVITAEAYNLPYAHPQVNTMLQQYLLPAVLR
ncbi:CubicO group peptidase, beta-lactamase class C family [Chitinophaga eiseniae]|uniref:CubicO group peptidase, beta-lactamase class C family n=1 Tax=Chitinophaga eiseniae TaxID=634771 RepID=A0A1T4TMS5_9BACT|nr:serine hydrolase [Chitinophaga eiseniae]SKA41750.1 CubicO group peptidase, beta-lactamase class C family [Chitinophaga eiseniae]